VGYTTTFLLDFSNFVWYNIYVIKRKEKRKMELAILELTKEEMEKIMKERELKARQETIEDLFEELKNTLGKIRKLGGSISLPMIGGEYVRVHRPRVEDYNVILNLPTR
jgi:hypothetical protein